MKAYKYIKFALLVAVAMQLVIMSCEDTYVWYKTDYYRLIINEEKDLITLVDSTRSIDPAYMIKKKEEWLGNSNPEPYEFTLNLPEGTYDQWYSIGLRVVNPEDYDGALGTISKLTATGDWMELSDRKFLATPNEVLRFKYTPTELSAEVPGYIIELPIAPLDLDGTINPEAMDTTQNMIEITVFRNNPPVAKLEVTKKGERLYSFDASKSHDKVGRAAFHGSIVQYSYTVMLNTVIHETFIVKKATTDYYFPGTGEFKVLLVVTDNDAGQSTEASVDVVVE